MLRIEAPQENRIVVELTCADMRELDITYEEMDYGNVETRRVIWTILDRARASLGCDIDPSGKLLIEIVPTAESGCMLYFTVLDPDRQSPGCRSFLRIRKESSSFTYAFDSLADLTECAVQLRQTQPTLPKSSLFLLDGRYRLQVRTELPPRRIRAVLSEYGTRCADGALSGAYLREHGKLLAENDAIEKLTIGL